MSTETAIRNTEAKSHTQSLLSGALVSRFHAIRQSAAAIACMNGLAIGASFVLVLLPFLTQYGSTFLVYTAILTSLTVAACCGFMIRDLFSRTTIITPWLQLVVYLGVLAWLICLPMINAAATFFWFSLSLKPTGLQEAVAGGIDVFDLLCLSLHSGCLLVPPLLFWINYIKIVTTSPPNEAHIIQNKTHSTIDFWLCLGVYIGFLLSAYLLGPWFGLSSLNAMLIAGCLIKLLFTSYHHYRHTSQDSAGLDIENSKSQTDTFDPVTCQAESSKQALSVLGLELLLLGSGCGIIGFALLQVSQQLIPVMTYTLFGQITAVLAGVLFGIRVSSRNSNRTDKWLGWVTLWIAAHSVLMLGLFPQWIHAMLFFTSAVKSVPLLICLRTITLAVLLMPIGILLGCVIGCCNQLSTKSTAALALKPVYFLCPLAGWLAAALCLVPSYDLTVTLICTTGLFLLVSLFHLTERCQDWLTFWNQPLFYRSVAGLSLLLICSSPWLAQNYQPALAARLLFGTNVFAAFRKGVDYQSLMVMDEGRLIETRMGTQGPLSVWSYRASQIQIRENGFPKGILSLDDRICPQYSAEVVTTLLPLVLHERAEEILILGLGSGLNVSTCLEYPVKSLNCVESNRTLIEMIDDRLWQHKPTALQQVGWQVMDPALAVQKKCGQYDVVLSFPDPPALAQSLPYFCQDFYSRAARSLKPDGIFCQRFSYVDFGPQPLQDVLTTLQGVFANVMMIETAPGELALMGTNCKTGLDSTHSGSQSLSNPLIVDDLHEGFLRDGFLRRLQLPQTRKILARLSWDWSTILNRSAFDNIAIKDFTLQRSPVPLTAANSRLAFDWPRELMRWAPKWQEIQAELAVDSEGNNRSSRLLAWLPAMANDQHVLQRLADTVGKSNLIVKYPDHPKAYRKSLRQHLSKQPRSVIRHVNGEMKRVLHEDEQRRKNYFEDLAKAVKQPQPTLEQIQHLELYAEPFDPILSYFLHYEIADLYQKLQPPDHRAEYLHRMHAIYYSNQQDRSVRNVARAIQVLNNQPNVLADAEVRYNHLNALLQVLKQRWELRKDHNPKHAGTAFNDVQKSLTAAESAISQMQKISSSQQVNHPAWPQRREYLERVLVRPLRAYRGKLKSHASKQNPDSKALLNYLKNQQNKK